MGVKLYLRYRQQPAFGVIASTGCNVLFDAAGAAAAGASAARQPRPPAGSSPAAAAAAGAHVFAPQLDAIGVVHLKQGLQLAALREDGLVAQATRIALDPSGTLLAAGYSDGSIRIWDTRSHACVVTFNGHRAPVSALAFDALGARLASGSADTDIVLWDVVAETGLFRLRGHKDQVTCLRFLSKNGLDHIVSGSKDTLVKFWDLATKHCVETLVTHRGEVWALDLLPDESMLLTGAADGQIRVWSVDAAALAAKLDAAQDASAPLAPAVHLRGVLERQSKERILTLKVDSRGAFIGVQGADRLVEIFQIRSEAEALKRINRRRRKQKRDAAADAAPDGDDAAEAAASLADRFAKAAVVRCSAKAVSFDLLAPAKASAALRIVCALANNSIEAYEYATSPDAPADSPVRLLSTVDHAGHRSDIRAIALSSDDDLLLTGSNDLVKVWSARTRQCLKSMASGYVLCCAFLPGNKHIIVGTKTGELQLFDLPSSSLLESVQAHSGPVWSLQVRADKAGVISGSQDKEVKVWDLRLKQDDQYSKITKRPTLVHTRSLKMSDDVLCVRQSPDGRLLAVALLDCTIKVFYYDTLKFFIALYGHKLPVISMDISFDSTLIATASSDKSVKIWGLDFGDCHKSLHAHEDSVMACQFVWGTHYLFTASKDKTIKYWDADKFEQIMRLEGHHGEVWALAIAKYGNFVVSGSHDRSIRIWEKTDDQFTIEEERERELEERQEREAAALEAREDQPVGSGAPGAEDGADPEVREVGAAGTKTADTLKAGEKIMEALAVWEKERGDFDKYERLRVSNPNVAPPPRSPYVIATGKPDMLPEEYVLHVVSQIRSSHLDEALLVLPFALVIQLLTCVAMWIEKGWNTRLTSRIMFFLLQTHHHELSSTRALRPVLERIRGATRASLKQERDRIGYNLAGIKFLQQEYDARHSSFFGDEEDGVGGLGSAAAGAAAAAADGPSGKDSKKKRKRHIKVVS